MRSVTLAPGNYRVVVAGEDDGPTGEATLRVEAEIDMEYRFVVIDVL